MDPVRIRRFPHKGCIAAATRPSIVQKDRAGMARMSGSVRVIIDLRRIATVSADMIVPR